MLASAEVVIVAGADIASVFAADVVTSPVGDAVAVAVPTAFTSAVTGTVCIPCSGVGGKVPVNPGGGCKIPVDTGAGGKVPVDPGGGGGGGGDGGADPSLFFLRFLLLFGFFSTVSLQKHGSDEGGIYFANRGVFLKCCWRFRLRCFGM